MRTALFLASGLMLLAAFFILARLFSNHLPSAATWALALYAVFWLSITAANMWVGVSKAGYSVEEELPIFLLLFGVPALVAIVVRWRLG